MSYKGVIKFRRVKIKKDPLPKEKIIFSIFLGLFFFILMVSFFNNANLWNTGSVISENTGESKNTAIINFVIELTDAKHLDFNKNFISNIYEEVRELDNIWSKQISSEEYIRVTFEENLTSKKDITIYPRIISGDPRIEVYETNETQLIAEFTNLISNEYNKVFLTKLIGKQDTFDLLILGGSLIIDHIIDPEEILTPLLHANSQLNSVALDSAQITAITSDDASDITIGKAIILTVEMSELSGTIDTLTDANCSLVYSTATSYPADSITFEVYDSFGGNQVAISTLPASDGVDSLVHLLDLETTGLAASEVTTMVVYVTNTIAAKGYNLLVDQIYCTIDYTEAVPNTPPTLSGLPEVNDDEDFGTNNSVMDLWDYASDAEDADSVLTYGINSESETSIVDCDIYDSHYITCTSQANASGYSDVNVSVTDTGGLKDSDVFRFTVNTINDDPWSDSIANPASINEDSGLNDNIVSITTINTAFRDVEEDQSPTSCTIASETDTTAVDCEVDGSYNVDCTTQANQSGSNIVTLNCCDSGSSCTDMDTFTVTVDAVNDNPWNDGLSNPGNVNEDSGLADNIITKATLDNTFRDVEEDQSPTSYAIQSQTGSSIINCALDGSNNIDCTTQANQSGSNIVTVRLSDSGTLYTEMTFTITVDSINDQPWVDGLSDPTNLSYNSGLNQDVISSTEIDDNFRDVENDQNPSSVVILSQTHTEIVNCELDGHALDCTTQTNQHGISTVTLNYTDAEGLSITDSMDISITPDTTTPTIQVQSPTNNSYTVSTIYFNATASETIDTWIVNYNGTNITHTINTSLEVEDGNHNLLLYANDSANNFGLNDTIYFTVDTQEPSLSNEFSNETEISQNELFCLNITVTDSLNSIDTVYAEVWDTSSWANYSMSEDGTSCSGTSIDGIYGVEIIGSNVGLWNYSKVYANDSLNNLNSYDFSDLTINVTAPADSTYPQFANFQTYPSNNSEYSLNYNYQFNSTITFTNSTVYLSFNGENYSATNDTVDNFYVNTGSISAGTYDYFWWSYGNGSLKNYNQSNTKDYTIATNNSDCQVLFNETSSLEYGNSFRVYTDCDSTFTLYKNGTTIDNNSEQNLGADAYNFTVQRADATNYTNYYDEAQFIISQATPVMTYYLNSVQNNISLNYPGTINASAYTTVGTINIYRNGTSVTSENNLDINLVAGYYEYLFNVTGNANYSDVSNEYLYFELNQSTSDCQVLFNETSSLEYGNSFRVYTDCDSTFTLYKNGTTIENNSEQNLGADAYNFTVQRADATNYTNYYDEVQFIINQAIGEVATYIDNLRNNNSVLLNTERWLNATIINPNSGNIKLYYDDNLINQGNSPLSNLTNFTSEGVFNISAIYDGNENYTSDIETWWVTVSSDSAPTINIIYPENTFYNTDIIVLNYTVVDDIDLSHCWYSLNNGTTNSSFDSNCANVTGLTANQGSNTWFVYANDSIGQESLDFVTFTKDTIYPNFTSYEKNPATPNEDQDIQVNVTITESNIDKVILEWDSTNYTITTSNNNEYYFTINNGNYTAHDSVTYYWYANDTAGNINKSTQQSFTVANQIPSVSAPEVNNTTPYTNDLISCNSGTFSDDDAEDTEQARYFKWYDTDVEISGQTSQTLDLTTAGLDKGDVILCSIRVYDGYDNSSYQNSSNSATIQNSNPIISNLQTTVSWNANGSTYTYDYEVTDLDSDSFIWYDNTTLFNINSGTGVISDIPTENEAGTYLIEINVSDGTVNTTDIFSYTINDVGSPNIDFQPPTETNESQLTRDYIQVNITASDSIGIDTITIYLYNQTSLVNETTNPTSPYFVNFTNLPDEFYYFNATVNDTSGNTNQTETITVSTDTGAPTINSVAPTETSGIHKNQNYVEVNVTASDPNLDKIIIRLYNSAHTQIDSTTTSSSPNFANFTGLNNGLYYYNVTANDTFGNTDSLETKNITLDTTKPSVLYNPSTDADNSFVNRNWILINISANDTNLDSARMEFDSTNETFANNDENNYWENKTSLSNGDYSFYSWANDSAENYNFTTTRTVTVDTINPLIDFAIETSINNSNLSQNYIFVNATLTETNFQNITYKLYNSTSLVNETIYTTQTLNINWTLLPNEIYTYNITTSDKASNLNSTATRTITLDTVLPQLNIIYPQSNTYTVDITQLNYTYTETIPDKCWWSNNSGIWNSSLQTCGTNWTGLTSNEGSNTWTIYMNDSAGNENSTSVIFTKDTAYPAVTINSPLNQTYDTTTILFNVTATDGGGISACEYSLSDGLDNNSMSQSGNFWTATNSSMIQGSHTVNFYCNDSSGNLNDTKQETFFIDSIYPLISFTTGTENNDTSLVRNWIFANVTVTENNFENITYILYNSTEEVNTTTYTTEIKEINWTGLSDEVYTYNVTICDLVNKCNTTETRTIRLDTSNPEIYYNPNTDSNNSFVNKNWVFINITASDLTKDSVRLEWGGTNETFSNSDGDLYWENKTGLSETVYNFYAWINDSSGNLNSTATRTVTIDLTKPSITNLVESPTDPTSWTSSSTYQFNATITDTNLDTVLIEFDNVNYTPTKTGDVYNLTLNNLVAGNYNYYWYANDSAGNVNQTSDSYTINKNTENCQILFNESSPQTYPATFLVYTDCNSDFTLTKNGTTISNNTEQILSASAYNFSVQRTDTVNYSNTIDESQFIVNQATGNITLLINDSALNQSGPYGTQTNVSATTSYGSVTLYRNETEITSENNVYVTLAANYYNYTAYSSGDQNHSSASITKFVTITKTNSEINLTLNETRGNITIVQDSEIYLNTTTISGDSSATLKMYDSGTLINQGNSPIINLTTFSSVGEFNITGIYVESENFTGYSETWWVNVTETPDTENPSVASLTKTPSSPTTYSLSQIYEFNATITDNRNIHTVLIEFDGTNYTPTNLVGNIYNFTINNLSVGNYNYRWYANDTSGNMNSTENSSYIINQATPSLSLNANPSWSETYLTQTTVTGSECPAQLTSECKLYRNDTGIVDNPNIVTLGVGIYNYTYNTTGNTNYTSYSNSSNLIISQNTGSCSIVFNESSSITYPSTFKVWTNCTSDFILYRNQTTIDNNSEQNLGAGAYNFTVMRTDATNYTNYYDEQIFQINKATGEVATYIDNQQSNKSLEQYTEIYLNATLETGTGNIKLYNNETLINQGSSPLNNLTNFTIIGLYNITTIYDGNENYTSDIETWWVNVTEADVTPPQISIIYPQNISYSEIQTQLNYTASDNFGLNLCWYSVDNGQTNTTKNCNENITGLNSGQGSSTWNVYANDSKNNLNFSSVTFFVDSILPTIQFESPTETSGNSLGKNYLQVNVTASDDNLNTITFYLYNSTSLVNETSYLSFPYFINYTGLSAETYYFNATANDTLGNNISTETRNISLVLPELTIYKPNNETYISSKDIPLRYSAEYEDYVWYNINQTENITITGNTTFNTTQGQHTLYLYANNTLGETVKNVSFSVDIAKFVVFYNEFKDEGSSTDFNQSSYEDIQNLSDIVLENADYGKIEFNEIINLTDDTNISDNEADLDTYINISSNLIEIDSTVLPNFNKSATLYLYNLTFITPRILKDGVICPSTICTQQSYSGGTLIFNVTGFTTYSAEEIPGTPTTPITPTSTSTGGGWSIECIKDSDCEEEDQVCLNSKCVKLFDIKITNFESPVKLGEFFEFTYLLKGMANISGDVQVLFWIEKEGESVTSGSDVIYVGNFEEKIETTKIFLPSTVASGTYQFFVKLNYEGYTVQSHRTIEIEVEGEIAKITSIEEINFLKKYVISFLIGLAILILGLIFYIERKKIKEKFLQEEKCIKKHKTSILVFCLFLVIGILAYYLKLFDLAAKTILKLIKSPYLFYILGAIILLIILKRLITIAKKREFVNKFKKWKNKRRIKKRLKKKYKSEVKKIKKHLKTVTKIRAERKQEARRKHRKEYIKALIRFRIRKKKKATSKKRKKKIKKSHKLKREKFKAKLKKKIQKFFFKLSKLKILKKHKEKIKEKRKINKPRKKEKGKFIKRIKKPIKYLNNKFNQVGLFLLRKEKTLTKEEKLLFKKIKKQIKQNHNHVFRLLKKEFKKNNPKEILQEFEEKFIKTGKLSKKHLKTLIEIIKAEIILKTKKLQTEIKKDSLKINHQINKVTKNSAELINDFLEQVHKPKLISVQKEKKRLKKYKKYITKLFFIKKTRKRTKEKRRFYSKKIKLIKQFRKKVLRDIKKIGKNTNKFPRKSKKRLKKYKKYLTKLFFIKKVRKKQKRKQKKLKKFFEKFVKKEKKGHKLIMNFFKKDLNIKKMKKKKLNLLTWLKTWLKKQEKKKFD
ncbi:hypothetical protein KAI04_00265 [Candidatus Pacearchaeota archaeon]|nr:hypothetical protein [Candidatus Pacearchaeota archaeon]